MAAMSSRCLLFVGPAGMDDRSLCERCETPSHRPLRALDYSDGRRKIVCPDCMTFEEGQVARESFVGDADEIAAHLEAIRVLSFDSSEARNARRFSAEVLAGSPETQAVVEEMRPVWEMPERVPEGWRLLHLDEREHWDHPTAIDGHLATLVKGTDPDLPLVVCECDWAPGLVHYRVDRQEG
jgi:hypothetical protein